MLFGECVKSLRSTLDYLAWQLALAFSATPPDTTAFPIFASKKLYKRDRLRFIGGIDPAIHPEFDAVQPCNRTGVPDPCRHPLHVLHRLANDNKHKTPTIVGSLRQGVTFSVPDFREVEAASKLGTFEDGEEIAYFGFLPGRTSTWT